MLRIASKDYGTPLFLILVATVTLVLLLLASKVKPKKGRPKVIKEDNLKRNVPRGARKESKPKATPKAIMRKLENCSHRRCRSTLLPIRSGSSPKTLHQLRPRP